MEKARSFTIFVILHSKSRTDIHFKAFVNRQPNRVQTCGKDKRRIIDLENS